MVTTQEYIETKTKEYIEANNVKVLDHGYIRLVEPWGSDERIIESARMSTGKAFLGWGPLCVDCIPDGGDNKRLDPQPEKATCSLCGKSSEESNGRGLMYAGDERLLRRLAKKKHTSPFEMAGATFEVQAPIMVFREWHRHRTQSYSEMSARYAPLPDMNYVPTVARCMANAGISETNRQASSAKDSDLLTEEASALWLAHLTQAYNYCETVYQQGLRAGIPKELARLIVPVGRYSRMRATANLHNWLRFLRLRLPDDAQWEIRSYAGILAEMLSDNFPRTMLLFGKELLAVEDEKRAQVVVRAAINAKNHLPHIIHELNVLREAVEAYEQG